MNSSHSYFTHTWASQHALKPDLVLFLKEVGLDSSGSKPLLIGRVREFISAHQGEHTAFPSLQLAWSDTGHPVNTEGLPRFVETTVGATTPAPPEQGATPTRLLLEEEESV